MQGGDRFAYVLHVGLPALPARVNDGRDVPVAVWGGERFGAVTVVEDRDGDLIAMVYTYRRVDGGWETYRGSGGFDWPGGSSSSAATGLHARETFFEGGPHGTEVWSCHLVEGFAGAAARWIELEEESGIDRRPIPQSGVVLAVRQGDGPAMVRVLDEHDERLGECRP